MRVLRPSVVNKREQQQKEMRSLLHEKRMHEETLRLIEECERWVGQSRQEQVSKYQAWSQLFGNMMKLKEQHKRSIGIGIPLKEMQQLMRHREASVSKGKVPATMQSISELDVKTGQAVLEGGSCAICLEDIASTSGSKVTVMPCDHRFHSPCLVRWLMANHSCPICRYKMPAAAFRR